MHMVNDKGEAVYYNLVQANCPHLIREELSA